MTLVRREATASVVGIFRALAQSNEAIAESLRVRPFQVGEIVCEADEMARSLFLVVSGRVQLYRTTGRGHRFVVATLGPGSMFGEASLLGGDTPNTQAVGLESGTIWSLPGKEALEILSTDAMFGFGLMQAIGERVKEAENRLEHMAYKTISSRLASLLLELGGDDPERVVHATHCELADMLGTWRETISKTLQDFRNRGWVTSRRRRVILLDLKSLQKTAGP